MRSNEPFWQWINTNDIAFCIDHNVSADWPTWIQLKGQKKLKQGFTEKLYRLEINIKQIHRAELFGYKLRDIIYDELEYPSNRLVALFDKVF